MEYFAAQKLAESWGKRTCDHPVIEKVFYNGAFLINYVCTQCGKEFTIAQKLDMEEERKSVIFAKK